MKQAIDVVADAADHELSARATGGLEMIAGGLANRSGGSPEQIGERPDQLVFLQGDAA